MESETCLRSDVIWFNPCMNTSLLSKILFFDKRMQEKKEKVFRILVTTFFRFSTRFWYLCRRCRKQRFRPSFFSGGPHS